MKTKKISICFLIAGIMSWLLHIGILHSQLEKVLAGTAFYDRVWPYLPYWLMGCGWMAMLDLLKLYRSWSLKPVPRRCLLLFFVFCSILFVCAAWLLLFAGNHLDIVFTVYLDRAVKSLCTISGAGLFIVLTAKPEW